MGKHKKTGLTGAFGARYGTSVRKRYLEIMKERKRLHECPQCHAKKVKRSSVGVWKCNKCEYTFAGGAYVPQTKLGITASRASSKAVTQALQTKESQ